jgi:hypothetical protein
MKTQIVPTLWPARPAKLLAGRERRGVGRRGESKPGHVENDSDVHRIAAWCGEKRVLKLRLRSARELAGVFRCGGAGKTAKGKGKAAASSTGSFNP